MFLNLLFVKQDSEFINMVTCVCVFLRLWTLTHMFSTLDLTDLKCMGTIWTDFPECFIFAVSLSVHLALNHMQKSYT